MSLDLNTLLIVSQCVTSLCGLLFLIEFIRERSEASQWFAIGFLFAPLAPIFYVLLSQDLEWSYAIGNCVATIAVAFTWLGARRFHDRHAPWWIPMSVPGAMTVGVLVSSERFGPWDGAVPFMLTFSGFSFLTAFEFLQGKKGEPWLHNSVILIVTCTTNGVFYLTRPAALLVFGPEHPIFISIFGAPPATLLLMLLVVASSFGLVSLGSERAHRATRYAARHDGLTKALNRKEFEKCASECIHGRAHDHECALLLLDLDHFKKINDTYGHIAGDEVLIAFAGIVRSCIGDQDIFARYGGEEFAVLLPGKSADDGVEIGERIRRTLQTCPDATIRQVGPTVSIGVSTTATCGADLPTLIAQADRALYQAKDSGRNRTIRNAALGSQESLKVA